MQTFIIIKNIILGIGIIAMLWFLIPLLITRNLNIGAATGLGLSALAIVYGIWGAGVNRIVAHLWQTSLGKILEIAVMVIAAAILTLAIMCIISMSSAAGKVPEPNSTVIVLGARVYEERVSKALQRRLDAAYDYLQENPESKVIVSGGQGKNEPCTESSLMKKYLIDKGIEPERIYEEDRSTDTQENLQYSKEIMDRKGLTPTAAIATEGYHEYRALEYAKEAGITAGAVPAHTPWWLFPTSVIREMYGILQKWFLK